MKMIKKRFLSIFLVAVTLFFPGIIIFETIFAATADDWTITNWNVTIAQPAWSFLHMCGTTDYIFTINGTNNIIKVDRDNGNILGSVQVGVLIFGVATDGTHIYVVSRNKTSTPCGVVVKKFDITTLTEQAVYYNESWKSPGGILYSNGYIYVSGGGGNKAIISKLTTDLNELSTFSYEYTNDAYFFEMDVDSNGNIYAVGREYDSKSFIYKFDSNLNVLASANITYSDNYRNCIVATDNDIIVNDQKQNLIVNFDSNLNEKWSITEQAADLVKVNPTYFITLQSNDDVTDVVTMRYISNGTAIWHYTGFDPTGTYYGMGGIVMGKYLYAYGNYSGIYYLRNITLPNISNYDYVEIPPPSPSEWDSIYKTHTVLHGNIDFSIPAVYERDQHEVQYMLQDYNPYTYYESNGTGRVKFFITFPKPQNVTYFRWYYYNPAGLQYAPALYRLYADGALIGEYNYTVSVNGQWISIDIDQYGKTNITLDVLETRGSIDSGSATNVSIAEIQLLDEGIEKISQDNIPYYLGIPAWWNGLQWAVALRIDDVVDPENDIPSSWLFMPLSIGLWDGGSGVMNPDWLIEEYHCEYATHGDAAWHNPNWDKDYTWWYNNLVDAVNDVESQTNKTSLWGTTCITFHIPYSAADPEFSFAAYDAGLRYAGNSPWPQASAPGFNLLLDGKQNLTTDYKIIPKNKFELLLTARLTQAKEGTFNESILERVRENGSFTAPYIHPNEQLANDFKAFIQNDIVGWHATIGEIASWLWYKWHTNVTLNDNSNSTVKIYDINIYGNDNRIWKVPITFAFNISGLGINESNIYDKVKVKYANGTEYMAWHDNIGGFFASTTQHRNQTMREGWRIDNDTLYLSFIPDGKQIYISSSNSPPNITINSPPTPADGATNVSINVTFSFDVDDPDGDLLTVTLWKYETGGTWTTWNETTVTPPATVTFQRSLAYNTTYKWRASVQDETNLVYANFNGWTFTTIEEGGYNHPPEIIDYSPENGSYVGFVTAVWLNVTVDDQDGDTLLVTWYNATSGQKLYSASVGGDLPQEIGYLCSNLSYNTTYSWFVIVDDGLDITISPTWSFTTMEETTGSDIASSVTDLIMSVIPLFLILALLSAAVGIMRRK